MSSADEGIANSFRIGLTINKIDGERAEFNNDYNDPTSSAYAILKNKTCDSVSVNKDKYRGKFVGC